MNPAHAGAVEARTPAATVPGAPPAGARAARSRALAPLLAVCLLAAALRFATLGAQSFDFDESFTVGLVLNGSLGHALHMLPVTESSPPLYYVVAWLWSRAFGLGPVGIRSLSALFGTALVPVSYAVARRLGSPRAGLIAALLVAVNPFLIWYSQEARTYSLLALLSALSFWAFAEALVEPDRRRFALWAAASGAAVLSHYFAVFLVGPEALWLIWVTRRRAALVTTGAVTVVGAALVPLLLSQADNRTQWIEALGLGSRIKEVAKKWVTGEIAPTRNWQLVAVAVVVGAAAVYGAARLTAPERWGAALALGTGAAALALPLALDLAGLHYLISKNVMPALLVLLIGFAVVLGAARAGGAGIVGAAVAALFFLVITVNGALDPALQRPDYRTAARALGPPARGQVVVTPNLGDQPMALYRPGAVAVAAGGSLAQQVIVVEPLPRADVSRHRPSTPPPPVGFRFEGRRDARTYTLVCFGAPAPRPVSLSSLVSLAGGQTGSDAQRWPGASRAPAASVCSAGG